MDESTVLTVGQQALYLIVMLAAPMLLSALFVGLIVGVFQAATQIQEQTLSFIPKLMGLVLALFFMGAWMLRQWLDFTRELYMGIPQMIG